MGRGKERLIDKGKTSVGEIDFSREDVLFNIYSKEALSHSILTQEEEIDLAEKIKAGWEAQEVVSKNGHLSSQKEEILKKDIKEGKQAREHFIRSNLRLVAGIAKCYLGRGVPLPDLIQEGNIGLMRAVEKYDITKINPETGKPYRFSTHAIWWIHQGVSRAIGNQGRTIRLPVHRIEERIELNKKKEKLAGELGREPNQKELADELGWSEEKVKSIANIPKVALSLNLPVGEDKDSYLGEMIEDEGAPFPPDETRRKMAQESVREAVDSLSERERRVLELRFGLKDGISRTLEEVGNEIGVTRERTRQIQAQALRKLRHPSRSRKLKDYLE